MTFTVWESGVKTSKEDSGDVLLVTSHILPVIMSCVYIVKTFLHRDLQSTQQGLSFTL